MMEQELAATLLARCPLCGSDEISVQNVTTGHGRSDPQLRCTCGIIYNVQCMSHLEHWQNREVKQDKPVLGQEAVCPDGLGRVISFDDQHIKVETHVETHVGNQRYLWDRDKVELIPFK